MEKFATSKFVAITGMILIFNTCALSLLWPDTPINQGGLSVVDISTMTNYALLIGAITITGKKRYVVTATFLVIMQAMWQKTFGYAWAEIIVDKNLQTEQTFGGHGIRGYLLFSVIIPISAFWLSKIIRNPKSPAQQLSLS